jgi:hypothetical protein
MTHIRLDSATDSGLTWLTSPESLRGLDQQLSEQGYRCNMRNSQWQHYLPEVYLRGFATASGAVWRYDRADGVLKLLPPRVIGGERDLYSMVDGEELSQEIENEWFNPLDGCFGPILRKTQNQEELSPVELTHLANFVAYLRVRTPASIRETELSVRQFVTQVGAVSDSVKYHSEPPDHGSDSFVMTEEQSDNVSTRRGDAAARNDVLKVLLKTGVQLAGALLGLDWTVLSTPHGRSFIVGDNPFVIVPPKSHCTDIEGVGPMTPGAATFVPLSSTLCLRVTNTGYLARRLRVDGDAVRAINACQVLNSERYVFGPSDALLSRLTTELVKSPGLNLAEVVIREAKSVSEPESRSLIHSFTKSKILPEWANRVPLD